MAGGDGRTGRGGIEKEIVEAFKRAVGGHRADELRSLLTAHPGLEALVNEAIFPFDSPAILVGRHDPATVDVLLEHGADINARSRWWAGGFGVLDCRGERDRAAASHLIARGAVVNAHAAAALDMLDRLQELVDSDPSVVHSRGGDGQLPLHFAWTPRVIDYLLDRGADIDARDVDHESTPAQWASQEEGARRHLIDRGASVDIFMACALGDPELVRRVLDDDPTSIEARVMDGTYEPVPVAPGGHIYTWEMGVNASPHQVADRFGHRHVYDLLIQRSAPKERFLAACWRGDGEEVGRILRSAPDLMDRLRPQDARLICDAAWENRLDAVRVMLESGFHPHTRGAHDSTPLDRAAFHGFADLVELLLQHDPPLELRNEFGGTPLGAAVHGAVHGWRRDGDHVATIEALVRAGSRVNPAWHPTGHEEVDRILASALRGA